MELRNPLAAALALAISAVAPAQAQEAANTNPGTQNAHATPTTNESSPSHSINFGQAPAPTRTEILRNTEVSLTSSDEKNLRSTLTEGLRSQGIGERITRNQAETFFGNAGFRLGDDAFNLCATARASSRSTNIGPFGFSVGSTSNAYSSSCLTNFVSTLAR